MNIVRQPLELLEDIQDSKDYKKELTFKIGEEEFFFAMFYKQDQQHHHVFNVFLEKEEEFLKCKENLKEDSKVFLSIGEFQWAQVGTELKPVPGLKHFISCQILAVRKSFIKVKIL